MAEPLDEELRALGVTDVDEDEDLRALGVTDAAPESPGPESVSPVPYGPYDTRDLEPSALGNIVDAGQAMGLLPTEKQARGAVASLVQGPAFTWADELSGVLGQQAALSKAMRAGTGSPDLEAAYESGRGAFREAEEGFRAESPKTAFALTALGGLAAPAPGAMSPSFGTRAAGATAMGALAGGGMAEEAEDIPFTAAVGAPLGFAGQAVGELAGEGVDWATSLLGRGIQRFGKGLVQPSPAAQTLQRAGVDELTIGQMAPKSFLAQMEEASTSVGGVGPAIKGQRDAAMRGVQQAALRESLPPGVVDVPAGSNLGSQVAAIDAAFDTAYSAAKGHLVAPRDVQRALGAIDDPTVYADDALREKAARWLSNRMTALRLTEDGSVLSDDVLRLRSDIRSLARNTQNPEERALLKGAEERVTDALNASMPAEVQQTLAATDRQYSKFRTVADAVWKAGDQPEGFTTKQLSGAIRSNTPERVYQRGGGPLRELAGAAEESIGAKVPMTGARLLATVPTPYVTGPLSYLANMPGPKRALLGQTPLQQRIQSSGALRSLAARGDTATLVGGAAGASMARAAGPSSQGDMLESLTRDNPEALGPYADQLQRASAGGTLALVHWNLQQTDPQYRAMLEALRKEQQ